MSLKELISKTSIANVVAGAVIILGGIYAYVTKNTNLMTFLVGAAVGYLFGKRVAA